MGDPNCHYPQGVNSVARLCAESARDAEAEEAARKWLTGKERILETGVRSAPLCGFRESSDGKRDFLARVSASGGTVCEEYTSGARIEYSGDEIPAIGAHGRLTRSAKYRVLFPDGGIFQSDESGSSSYTAPSGRSGRATAVAAPRGNAGQKSVRNAKTVVRFGASARLFASAAPANLKEIKVRRFRAAFFHQRRAQVTGRLGPIENLRDCGEPQRQKFLESLREAELSAKYFLDQRSLQHTCLEGCGSCRSACSSK